MKTIALLVRYLKKNWLLFIVTILSVIFLNYLRSIIPLLTGTFISIVDHKDLLESETPKFLLIFYQDVSEIKYQLLITSLLIVCIAFIREITNIFVDVSIYHLSETIGCKAQIDYFKKVQDLPYVYLNHASSGDLIQRSTQDINRFKQFVTGSLLELFNSLCKVIIFVFHPLTIQSPVSCQNVL